MLVVQNGDLFSSLSFCGVSLRVSLSAGSVFSLGFFKKNT
jgi:hypothetical protein